MGWDSKQQHKNLSPTSSRTSLQDLSVPSAYVAIFVPSLIKGRLHASENRERFMSRVCPKHCRTGGVCVGREGLM